MFRKKKILDYKVELPKLAFINAMTNAADVYRHLMRDNDGNYFLLCDLIHTVEYRNKESELEFNCILKVPVDIPFEKMDGLDLLRPESKELKAVIDFNKAKVVLVESFSPFYQMIKVLKEATGEVVEKAKRIDTEFEVSEQGLNLLLEDFISRDDKKKDSDNWSSVHYEKFKQGFIKKEFITSEYERFTRYKKKAKHLCNL